MYPRRENKSVQLARTYGVCVRMLKLLTGEYQFRSKPRVRFLRGVQVSFGNQHFH